MANLERTKSRHFEQLPFKVYDDEKATSKIFGVNGKWVKVGEKKSVQPEKYKKCGLDIYNFQARPDDVYLLGVDRSGTTMVSEMVWLIANDLDFEAASKSYQYERFPYIDSCLFPRQENVVEPQDAPPACVKNLIEQKRRRFIKCHLPLSLMSPSIFEVGAKVVYCARNPKSVIISHYDALRFFKNHRLDFKETFYSFKNNNNRNGPYFEHVKEAWARRNDDNFLFLFFEDILMDMRQAIVQVADLLGKKLTSDQLDALEDHLSIENFRKNKSVNHEHLVEKGMVDPSFPFINDKKPGSRSQKFTGDLEREADEWIEENLKGTDLRFPMV